MIVLDTHAWLWWSSLPAKLSRSARKAIESASAIGVSAISCWEVAALADRGRIELDRDVAIWIDNALADERVLTLPLTSEIAVRAALLGREGFHADPADRMIYATARVNAAPLVTRDRRLQAFDRAGTLW